MERKKIAFFCWESLHTERVGGLASAATSLAQELARNHEVHYFTRGDRDFTYAGVHYHSVQPSGNNIVEYCGLMSNQMVDRFLEQEQGSSSFDILHFHDWHVTEALHRLQDRNTLFTYHSTEYGRNGNNYGDWWEFREISGKEWYAGLIAKQVTAVSQVLRDEVMRIYQVPEWKVKVVHNGVIPEQFDVMLDQGTIKQEMGIHPYAPTLLYIGRMTKQKGPDLLIEALPEVVDRHWGTQVVMAGTGDMLPRLSQRASDLNLPVRFPGYISDAQYVRLLAASDLVVIPSRNEPFGIVLPEAWSAGRSVVACNVGGLSENIDPYENGITTPVSVDGLAHGLNEALDNIDQMPAYGRSGRKKVYQQFQWKRIADRMDRIYQGVGS